VATNHGREGRLYVIALDEVPTDLALRTRHFLHRFVEQHLEPNDVATVVSVGRARAGDMQDFTSNRRLLLKAIDTFSGGFPGDPMPNAVRSQARALRDLMEALANIHGRRKALLYITHQVGESSQATLGGADVFDVLDYKGGVRSIQFDDLRAAMTAAMRGGVAIYALDPAGLDPGGGLGESETAPESGGAAELDRMASLRRLSEATGGFGVVNSNSIDEAFTRLVKENSTYYVLGFTSTNDKRDGRYRRLQVRTRRPGLTVRNRDGYIAPSKSTAPSEPKPRSGVTLAADVAESIAAPLANGSVPISVFAAAYRGPAKEANIVITVDMDATRLDLTERGTTTDGEIEVAAVAVAAAGKVTRGQRERFTLSLKPETWAEARRSGVRLQTGMTLPPGRYQLRVAGGNTKSPKAGSVIYDLDVPDFGKPPLALSALSLSSRQTTAAVLVPSKSVRPVVPTPPTTTREFTAGDTLSVYGEVYDNRARDAHRLDFVAELRGPDGNRVGRAASDTRANGQALQKFEATLPLDVPPGSYVLHVEARSTLAKQPPVSRDVPLRVR
jgi:VWFA-related protein